MARLGGELKPPTMQLTDGRTLAWAEYGDPAGRPVFHFHGHPGSRWEGAIAHPAARRLGVRLIATDRPGMGYSEFQPARRILDWPGTVVELAGALGIDRFAVQGVSGGGPYALACAAKIPGRLTGCGVVAGMGPLAELGTAGMLPHIRLYFQAARWAPWKLRPLLWLVLGRHRRPGMVGGLDPRGSGFDEPSLQRLVARLSHGNPDLAERSDLATGYLREILEAFRQGSRGPAYEARLFMKPWGFRLEEIEHPSIHLWHGKADRHVPVRMGHAMAAAIPHCRATFFPGEDHFAPVFRHLDEILATVSGQA